MSWNPFKKNADEPGASPRAAAAGSADDDRTDPLVSTGALTERSVSIRQNASAVLDRIEVVSNSQVANSFLRLRIVDAALAAALRQAWLELPEEQTGFVDLLACEDYPLCARLADPDVPALPDSGLLQAVGQPVFRLLHLLQVFRDVARLLDGVYNLTGLAWPDAGRHGIGLHCESHGASGLSRVHGQFLAWDELQSADMPAAASNLYNLLSLCLAEVEKQAAAGGFALAGSAAAGIQAYLAQHLTLESSGYGLLAGLLDSIQPVMQMHSATDVGRRREHNEDASLVLSLDQLSMSGARLQLAAVADGMGGHASGEVASSLTLSLLRQHLLGGLLAPSSRPLDAGRLQTQLETAIPAIDRALQERAALEPELSGMGTTLVGLAALSAQSTTSPAARSTASQVFWVGDSRAYLLGSWGIAPLSVDHSHVRDLVAAGSITEEQARDHPLKNVITRCLGGSDSADGTPDVHGFNPGPGELILLCSDGLSDVLTDEEIWRTVCGSDPLEPQAIARALIDAANHGGGPDNITVVLISCSAG